jgi:hypothetical protein
MGFKLAALAEKVCWEKGQSVREEGLPLSLFRIRLSLGEEPLLRPAFLRKGLNFILRSVILKN